MALNPVTDASFEEVVLKAEGPVLVKFTADWCGPCRQLEPILQELSAEIGDKIDFRSLDVDENVVTASSYRVSGIPTIKVFKGGEEVLSIVGARPKAALQEALSAVL